jgi:GTPase SAR1 family protein
METNPQLKLASEFVQFTDRNIFLTGKAGTGKTTFLHNLRKSCPKRMIVVAPTGVAAINAGGSTIHSFFQLPFGPFLSASLNPNSDKSAQVRKMNREKINLIKSLDLLVIDEISMVRADTLDGIDEVLRKYRDREKPFGGVQLLMIGDLHQLSPVVRDDDWRILKDYYPNLYFFNSTALKQSQPISIELKHIYRQTDTYFIDILNAVRENKIDAGVLEKLNARYIPNFNPHEDEGYITLTSHNQSANEINEEKLKELTNKAHHFIADVNGDFPEFLYPNAQELVFKEGVQVMFVKNDVNREKLYYNGKIGKITKIKDGVVYVKCPGTYQEIGVGKAEWENKKFELNPSSKEIVETTVGTFFQYPIKLAWAITIHKSQGLTFEKAIIDANSSFAHGQVYVALSRCKSFEGLVLRTPISFGSIKTDGTVSTYTKNAEENEPDENHLTNSKIKFQQNLLFDLFDFRNFKISFFVLRKIAQENHHIISLGFLDNLNQTMESVQQHIYDVADKFKRHLNNQLVLQSLPEENEELQERVKKACHYFIGELQKAQLEFEKVNFDADNKSVKKAITEAQENLKKEFFIKDNALKLCVNGFEVLAYLKTKANAEIDFANQKKETPNKSAEEKAPKGTQNGDLYIQLKQWRDNLAAENGSPVYQILPQKTLLDLVKALPNNFEELESIKGIGKVKVKMYGNEILTMIGDYCEKMEISRTPFQKLIATQSKKNDSKEITINMFKAGKSIAEIAAERGFAASTIESHLIMYIEIGELDIKDFVTQNYIDAIEDFLSQNPTAGLNDVKAALPDQITYNEIKAVMKSIAFNNSLN